MKLTENFFLEEFLMSDTATRLGIDNVPNKDQMANIVRIADQMQRVRRQLSGRVISITSGFRSPELNRAVGGSMNSYHMDGLAVDFVCRSYGSPLQVAGVIAACADIRFDQLIHEYGRWVHIGFARPGELPRGEVLTIDRHGTRTGLHEVRQ